MLSTGFINVLQSWGQVCPFHTSTLWPIWGKERKCKKEMSVGRHPEEVVIRMMAWWVAQGFLEQRWVFVVTCVPITSSSQQCWCRHHTLTRWIWIRAETFVDVVVRYSPTWSHGPNVCHSDSMWLDSAKDTSLSADLTRPMRNFADATYWWYLAQHHDQSIPWKLKMHFLSDAQFVPVAVLCVLAIECGTQPVSLLNLFLGRHRRSLWMSCHRWMSWRMRSSTIALWGEAFWLAVELHWLHLILMLDLNWFQIVVIPRCHLQCCAWTVLADLVRS